MPDCADTPKFTALLFGLSGCLVDFGACSRSHDPLQPADEFAHPTQGALATLEMLHAQSIPCAWQDELPSPLAAQLCADLPGWLHAANNPGHLPAWPAPDGCWHALMGMGVPRLEGCVLVSGEPRLLQAGLNAGLWTVGLASCGSLCGASPSQWLALSERQREQRRGQATVQLFNLGVHSVIDHLEALDACLADIALRRLKGEKP